MRCYVATLGFDEKFVIRFLVRHRLDSGDLMIVFVPSDYEENERVVNALRSLRSILENWLEEENIQVVPVDVEGKPEENIAFIMRRLRDSLRKGANRIYASLSGGMRILVVLVALGLLRISLESGVPVDVEIDFETFKGYVAIPLETVLVRLNSRQLLLLKKVSKMREPSVRRVSEEVGYSSSTVYRELLELQRLGLIDEKYQLTSRGSFLLTLYT